MGEYNGGGAGNSEWTVDGNGNLVPKDGEPVSIDDLSGASDVSDTYDTKVISPDVADAGAAVNTAISELGAGGGTIKLPYAPNGIAIDTKIDLSVGVNGQNQDTPIILEGHGNPAFDQQGGTLLDATNLADHVIQYDGDNRENIHFRDFCIQNVDASHDGFNLGVVNDNWHRNSSIKNIGVFGSGRWGINSYGGFGSAIRDCYVGDGVSQAYRFANANSISVENIIARFCSADGYAVHIDNSKGGSFRDLYIESNQGSALYVGGGTEASGTDISGLYTEGNNRAGNSTTEIEFENSKQVDVGPAYLSAGFNAFGDKRILVTSGDGIGFQSLRGSGSMDYHGAGFGRHTFTRCVFDEADTTNSGNGSTWIQNIIGTDNRNGNATILSGQ